MSKDNATENLRAELKSLADTLEEVLSSSGDKSKEEMSKIRSKAEHALRESRHRLSETSDVIAKQTREARLKPITTCAKTHGQASALALQSVWCLVYCCRAVNNG